MSQVINTNVGSLNAQNALNSTQNASKVAMERLASGKRINHARDDAAGLAIGEAMTAQIKGTNQAIKNTNDGISYVQTAEGALNEISTMLQRARELRVQHGNETLTSEQKGYLDAEFDQLQAEISNVVTKTEFNDIAVLNDSTKTIQSGWEDLDTMSVGIAAINTGSDALEVITGAASSSAVAQVDTLSLGTVGNETEYTVEINGSSVSFTSGDAATKAEIHTGLKNAIEGHSTLNDLVTVSDLSSDAFTLTAKTAGNALTTTVTGTGLTAATTTANVEGDDLATIDLGQIDAALDFINDKRADLGAQQNRLEHNASNLANVSENMSAARSQIMDADFAAESAELARTNVLQQAGMSMLAQANQAPNNILALVR